MVKHDLHVLKLLGFPYNCLTFRQTNLQLMYDEHVARSKTLQCNICEREGSSVVSTLTSAYMGRLLLFFGVFFTVYRVNQFLTITSGAVGV